jgi:hypothetical protein
MCSPWRKSTATVWTVQYVKGIVSRDLLLLVFLLFIFHQASAIALGSFQIFSQIRRDICKSRCTTSTNDTGGKFEFATSINDIGGKFAANTVSDP